MSTSLLRKTFNNLISKLSQAEDKPSARYNQLSELCEYQTQALLVSLREDTIDKSGFLEIATFENLDLERRVFIREDYLKMMTIILESPECHFMIKGDPGIGKSCFLQPLLALIVKSNKPVAFVSDDSTFLFAGNKVFSLDHDPTKWTLKMDDLWVLYDSLNPVPKFSKDRKVVVVTSPKRSRYAKYEKYCKPMILFMPPWSLSELKALNANIKSLDELELVERYRMAGGSPRDIFTNNWTSFVSSTRNAAKKESLPLPDESGIVEADFEEVCHRVYSIEVVGNGSYLLPELRVRSPWIKGLLLEQRVKKERLELARYLREGAVSKAMNSFVGTRFERFSMMEMAKGGIFEITSLLAPHTPRNVPRSVLRLRLPELPELSFYDPKRIDVSRVAVWRPLNERYATVDFVLTTGNPSRVFGLQMTISERHGVDYFCLEILKDIFGKDFAIIFVVSQKNDAKFISRQRQYKGKDAVPLKNEIKVKQFKLLIDFK